MLDELNGLSAAICASEKSNQGEILCLIHLVR